MVGVSDEQPSYDPTFRQTHVDDTLTDHEARIGRLEKAALVGVGYGLASGIDLFQQAASLLF